MGPLEGLRVVELGVWIAAPAAGMVLADWGADVVKIEPPGVGDPARLFAGMLGGDLPFNPPFEMDNRNKRGICLNLSKDEGRNIALELIDQADVFITNVRMPALERLGLGHVDLLTRNPRLIYGLITGFGTEGPDRDRAAYDIGSFWARSGVAHMLTSPQSSGPPFQRGGMGDHGTGLALAGAVSAALVARERTGKGQFVSTSLLRQGTYTISFDLAITSRFGVGLAVADRETMGNPVINCYRDKDDRWFWLIGLEGDRHWPSLCRAAGKPEWIDDERYKEFKGRAANAREIITELDAIFATKSREEWGEIFDAQDALWWAPVQNLEEVMADEQVAAAKCFAEVPDQGSTTMLPASPGDFEDTPVEHRSMAPELGQHNAEILTELGRGEDFERLKAEGVLG